MHTLKQHISLLEKVFVLIVSVSFCCSVNAQAQSDTIILNAKNYLDVEKGRLISPAVLVIRNGMIAEINPTTIPKGKQLNLPGKTLVPGLMDAHTHISLSPEDGWDTEAAVLKQTDFAVRAVSHARTTLLSGFTTIRDLFSMYHADIAVARGVKRGDIIGPDIIGSGYSIGITGGHCDITGFAPGILEASYKTGIGDGQDELVKAVRYQIKHGAKVIKICATAGVMSMTENVGNQQMSDAEIRAVVEEAHRHGLKVAAHAHGTEGIIAASNAGVDSIEHASILTDKAAKVLAENGTWIVPNLYLIETLDYDSMPPLNAKKSRYIDGLVVDSFVLALKHNLKIAFGTDASIFPHGDNANEMISRVKHGQKPIEVIRSATINNAELFGLSDRGNISVGLRADIIAVKHNPLEDMSAFLDIPFVMQAGVVHKKQ
ncbi:amidohydrolase family protein [Paraglaciecola aestuariivivens]